jgi:hypothetical protein
MGSRSTRSALAVTMATLMVAVAAVTAAAQSPSATPVHATTFTATSDLDRAVGYTESVTGSEDGVTRIRVDFATIWTATDPRASGTATFGVDRFDHGNDVTVHSGTFRLENEGGGWEGGFTGFWDAGGRRYDIVATGTGGYAGWTLVAEDLCACDSPTSVASGVIVPGGLPSGE